jgi:uncharacterized repeat protein (TIGR01451 family)
MMIMAAPVFAADTGFLSPSANASLVGGDGNGYETTPTNAYADGGGSAVDTNSGSNTNDACWGAGTDKHSWYNFNFTIPTGSYITGIQIRQDLAVDSLTNAPFACSGLSWNGGANWDAGATPTTLSATGEITYLFGGQYNPWGRSWSTSEFTNANFRVRTANGDTNNGNSSRDFSLDWITAKVFYVSSTTPPSIASITADDPDNGDNVLSNGDTLTILFDIPTNAPLAGNTAQINGLLNFAHPLGTAYIGSWQSTNSPNDTLKITILNAVGGSLTVGDTISVKADGTDDLKNASSTSAASTSSASVAGDWGSIMLYYSCDGNDNTWYIYPDMGVSTKNLIGSLGVTDVEAITYNPINGELLGANGGQLGVINQTTGVFTNKASAFGTGTGTLGSISFNDVDGLAFDPWTATLYGTLRRPNVGDKDLLFKINPTTGALIANAFGVGRDYVVIDETGVYDDIDDIGINPVDGKMYTVGNQGNATEDQLLQINKFTGTINVQGNFGSANDVEGMDFSSDGRMWGTIGSSLAVQNRLVQILYNQLTPAITGSIDLTPNCSDIEAVTQKRPATNMVTGTVWNDINGDQVFDVGEGGLSNVTLKLYYDVNNNDVIDGNDEYLQSVTTSASGQFTFYFFTTGTLVMEIDANTLPGGYGMTTDNIEEADFTDYGQTEIGNNFGARTGPDCDNDGLPDFLEGNGDTDGDSVADKCDLDSDNDGILDSVEGANDKDGDGVKNYLDLDSDNDGIPDAIEANTGVAPSGYITSTGRISGFDTDSDGLLDVVDSLPLVAYGASVSILANPNTDGDIVKNYLDLDSDNDGILDIIEAGGTDSNNDGQVDSFADANGDGLNDSLTTSPLPIPNTDANGKPDYIDMDADGDGIPDFREGQSTAGYHIPVIIQDIDSDGVIDAYDIFYGGMPIVPVDKDSDGTPDYRDLDTDNDGVPDRIEGYDANKNGVADVSAAGADTDGDGIDNAFDTNNSAAVWFDNNTGVNAPLQDTDSDGEKDWRDVDDDNDGVLTINEDNNYNGNWADDDYNSNGIPDYLDPVPVPVANLSGSYKVDSDVDNIVAPGDFVTYTIYLVNSGTATATPVTTTDVIDSHYNPPTNFVFSNCGAATSTFSTPTATINSISVYPSSTCVISYVTQVKNPLTTPDPENETISNTANIFPSHGAATLHADSLSINVAPNLSTSVLADNDADNFVNPTQVITYTLSIINTGNGTDTGVAVTNTINANLENMTVTGFSNCGSSYVNTSTAAGLNITNLMIIPSTTCVITFTAVVSSTAGNGATIPMSASVETGDVDGTSAYPSADTLTVSVPTVQFSLTNSSGSETVSPVNFTVALSATSSVTATVDYAITGGSASNGGIDYTLTAGTLTFAPGTVSQDIIATVIDDALFEGDEDFIITLSNPSSSTLGANTSHTYTILDNESVPSSSPDLSTASKTDNDADNIITPGQTITYTITIPNIGSGVATDTVISDVVPSYLGAPSNIIFTNCGISPTSSFASPNISFSSLELATSTTCVITYDVTLVNPLTANSPELLSLTNSATLSPNYGSPVLTADTLTPNVTPNLSGSAKTENDSDNIVSPSQSITYTLTLINSGDGTGNGISVTDTLNSNLESLSGVALTNCGGGYVNNSTATELLLSGLRVVPGINCVITFNAQVKSSAGNGVVIPNSAIISPASEGGSGSTPSASSLTVSTGGGGGGGGGGSVCTAVSNTSININNGDTTTVSRNVVVSLNATNATEVALSEDLSFTNAVFQPFAATKSLTLSAGSGLKTIYAKFKNQCGTGLTVMDNISVNEAILDESKCSFSCSDLSYDVYIVNPDKTERHMNDARYAKIKKLADGTEVIYFEDKGVDNNFADVVVTINKTDCRSITASAVTSKTASWHHQIKIKLFYKNTLKDDVTLWEDSHLADSSPTTFSVSPYICPQGEIIPAEETPTCSVSCSNLTYDVYIINPNGSERHMNQPRWAKIKKLGDSTEIISFEDKGVDNNYKDVIVTINMKDCKNITASAVTSKTASWHHQIRIKIFEKNILKQDYLMWGDSHQAGGSPISFSAVSDFCSGQTAAGDSVQSSCVLAKQLTNVLQKGMQNEDVLNMQKLLKCFGYIAADQAIGGYFGTVTETAVKKFQTSEGIDAVGDVGPVTMAAMNKFFK